jgi:Calcineurin-like phosphoesterase
VSDMWPDRSGRRDPVTDFKILCVGDLHFSDRPPSSCTDTYLDDLFNLVAQTTVIADPREGYGAVVWAGDVFHVKTPSRNSHSLVQRVIEAASAYRVPLFVVPGNHDMSYDRFESILETQPLGTLLRSGACHLLSGWADSPSWGGQLIEVLDPPTQVSGLPLYGVPWLQDWADQDAGPRAVLAALFDFQDRFSVPHPRGLVVTHAPFYPPGLELPYENYPTAVFSAQLNAPGWDVYYGHVHEAHGIYQAGCTTFANMGALSRGSLTEHDLTRVVSVASWSPDSGFTQIPLRYRPSGEVFRVEEIAAARQVQVDLDNFLAQVGVATIEITSIEAVVAHVQGLGLEPAVVQVVVDLLREAQCA